MSADQHDSSDRIQEKRKSLHLDFSGSSLSKEPRQSSIEELLTSPHDQPRNSERHLSKRQKTDSQTTIHLPSAMSTHGRPLADSRMDFRSRTTSNFQPHMGAKTLVIKNLRTTPRTDVGEYYTKTWAQLNSCLTSIFEERQVQQSLEQLYKGVEDTCRQGGGEKLFKQLRDRCEAHLSETVLPTINYDPSVDNIEALRKVLSAWKTWEKQLVRLTCLNVNSYTH
jgi:hypothetical protein